MKATPAPLLEQIVVAAKEYMDSIADYNAPGITDHTKAGARCRAASSALATLLAQYEAGVAAGPLFSVTAAGPKFVDAAAK